jgi:Ca2+-binding RTX toxin-like protein
MPNLNGGVDRVSLFKLSGHDDVFPETVSIDVSGNDTILALAGDDSLSGGRGDDRVYGGAGNDTILWSEWDDEPDSGADLLVGGDGDDLIYTQPAYLGDTGATPEDDTVRGGAGNDQIYGGVNISGGAGDDVIDSLYGAETISGGVGNDHISVRYYSADLPMLNVSGDDGDDALALAILPFGAMSTAMTLTRQGDVLVDGRVQVHFDGFETLFLDTDSDQANLRGGAEQDFFTVSGNAGTVQTGGGRDTVTLDYSQRFDGGTYSLDGGRGRDVLRITAEVQNGAPIDLHWSAGLVQIGGQGSSHFSNFERLDVLGTAGDDTVLAGDGRDHINGSFGNDLLLGRDGNDTLEGGFGGDRLVGGTGADVFVYTSENDSYGGTADRIVRFEVRATVADGWDRIDLRGIDGVHSTDVMERLTYIGEADFTLAAQVRVEQDGTDAWVLVNTDSDLAAEIKIILEDFTAATLGSENFIL